MIKIHYVRSHQRGHHHRRRDFTRVSNNTEETRVYNPHLLSFYQNVNPCLLCILKGVAYCIPMSPMRSPVI